jgi:taurine dioxygenase
MHERALQPVGVEVSGLDLDAAGPDDVDHLQNLLARHGVVIMRGQDVDDPAFLGFLRRFGELAFTTGEPPLPGYPDLNLVSNVGRTTPPRSTFHVDTSYVRHPPAYTALRAVRIPAQGGETLFTNQYRAYDTLPADVRERLRGRTIRHEVTGLDLGPTMRPRPSTPSSVRTRYPAGPRSTCRRRSAARRSAASTTPRPGR